MLTAGVFAQVDVQMLMDMYNGNIDKVPDFVKSTIGDENLHIIFTTSTGEIWEYAAVTKAGKITEAAMWADGNGNKNHDAWEGKNLSPTMELHTSEQILIGIAGAQDPVAALRAEWGKGIEFRPVSIVANVKMLFVNVGFWFAGFFMPPALQPSTGKAGSICQNGGECDSGNCLYVSGQGADRLHKCSCEQFVLTIRDPCPQTIYNIPQSSGKAIGELCNHGGECNSGNCIGVGQGPPWTYKCSCDPFKYDAYSC